MYLKLIKPFTNIFDKLEMSIFVGATESVKPYLLDIVDIVLSVIGMIPFAVPIAGQIGVAADASAIVLNAMADEPIAMILSIFAVVPLAGEFSGAIKIIYKIVKILEYVLASPLIKIGIAILGLVLIIGIYYFIYFI